MLNKVTDTRSAYAFVKEGWRMVKQYGWYDKVVYPYSFPVKVTKLLHEIADYGKCTEGSKAYLNSMANGLGDILNHWEAYEQEEDVEVVKNDGTIKTFKESIAKIVVESGDGRYLDDLRVAEMEKGYDEMECSGYFVR